jgi:hypothetical protein
MWYTHGARTPDLRARSRQRASCAGPAHVRRAPTADPREVGYLIEAPLREARFQRWVTVAFQDSFLHNLPRGHLRQAKAAAGGKTAAAGGAGCRAAVHRGKKPSRMLYRGGHHTQGRPQNVARSTRASAPWPSTSPSVPGSSIGWSGISRRGPCLQGRRRSGARFPAPAASYRTAWC